MNHEKYTVDDFLMDDQFLAYCQGSDPAAVRFWEIWQSGEPPNMAAFREAEKLCKLLNGQKPRLDTSLQELESMIRSQKQPAKIVPMPTRSFGGFQWWAVAATVLLVSGLGWAGYWFWGNQYVSYETAYNQQRTVQLPDGSSVILNSHSTLRHKRSGFSTDERTVELEGEGFFVVQHLATNAPFRVKTNGAFDVQVLGTEFSIYNRPALHRVVLNSGRVNVVFRDNRPALTLRPGQLIEVGDSMRQLRQRNVRADQYNAWLRNQLVFDNASLTEVIQMVEEQFGVAVRLDNEELGKRSVTGILPINKPETVLNALAELTQLKIRKTKNTFILSKK